MFHYKVRNKGAEALPYCATFTPSQKYDLFDDYPRNIPKM